LKKSYEIAALCDVSETLFIRIYKIGRLISYRSLDLVSWPLLREQIQIVYPLQVNLLPQDVEAT
ncbi:hypothetical protein BKA61DRAFT_470539, partial [Leptodontidium sp. MPI-SDFR-AT-0119]